MKPIVREPRQPRPALARAAIVVSVVLLAAAAIVPVAGESARRPNHLLGQSSPYLLEHLDNPVDWYPWGDEAIALARREQKPIFLSIGYSACHWCHVMAREAFSDEEIAQILRQHFVSIKVDRQERPDLDALYMEALQAMTGGGGWPMSLFLTPDLKPFYGGTYFPRDQFRDRLLAIAAAWDHNRQKALAAADSVQRLLKQQESEQASGAAAPRQAGDAGGRTLSTSSAATVKRLEASFDRDNGGFGTRPKFPPHGDLWLLLEEGDRSGGPPAPDMVVRTLDAMARGGIYDQVGGGFHRYATDERWQVPHFEKMLYDNALLIPLYLEVSKRTGRSDFRRVAEETIAWAEREMADARGSFCASLDADSSGEEGRFYLWTRKEAREAIGEEDADLALAYFGLSGSGPSDLPRFEGDRMLPHVSMPLAQLAAARGLTPDLARTRIEAARQRLFDARSRRERPRRDDSILTAWNGLMISALAKAARLTDDPRHLAAATRAARNVLATALDAGGRPRVSFIGGRAGPPGTLDDSAFLARGLLDLYDAGSDRFFLDQAARIVRDAARFFDARQGGYFLTDAGRPDLIARTRSLEDGPLISGNAAMVECLGRLSARLGDPSFLEPARKTLEFAAAEIGDTPIASPYLLLAARFVDGAGSKEQVADAAAPVSLLASPAMAADSPGAPATQGASAPAAPAASGVPTAPRDSVLRGTIVGRANPQQVVTSSITVPSGPVRPGQAVTLSLKLEIGPGWHINSAHPTLSYLIPTRIEFPDPAAATVEDVAYPEGKLVTLEFAQEKLSVYEGAQAVRATLSPPPDAPAGRREIPARVTYQACSNKTCLAPEIIEFKIPIDVQGAPVVRAPRAPTGLTTGAATAGGAGASPAPAATGGGIAALLGSGGRGGEGVKAILRERGLLVLLGVVFLAGLALNLTPCVYPMMPVTIGFFVNQASGSWRRRAGLPSLYVLGMAVTYSVLGVLAGLTGSLFGSWLQSPWVTGTLVLIFIVMALSMFGLFEIRMPGWLTRFSGGRQGAIGAFLMGLTMGVAAAPCIGPFIVPLLAFVGAAGKPVLGFWLFFVMAIGMGVPNLFLGFFSGAIGSLPRSGTWLIYAKKVMGVALLAVALYFVQPFLPDRRLGIIVLGFACASGAYLALLEGTRMAARWFRPLRMIIGLSVVGAGAWIALPMINARPGVDWRPYSAEALDQAKAAGRPVILDFFADWCLPCKELDRFTFSDPAVIDEGGRFLFMKADMTSFESQTVRALRERFGIVGVPTVILIDGQGSEHQDLRVYGYEDPPVFLKRMLQVR